MRSQALFFFPRDEKNDFTAGGSLLRALDRGKHKALAICIADEAVYTFDEPALHYC